MHTVLLITEDQSVQRVVENATSQSDCQVLTCTVAEALTELQTVQVDALIFDENESMAFLNAQRLNAVILQSNGNLASPPAAARPVYEVVKKPVVISQLEEAIARVCSNVRAEATPVTLGDLDLDPASLEVHRGTTNITLTPLEFRLLRYLGERQGKIASTADILHDLWDLELDTASARLVRSHVSNLRSKLHRLNTDRDLITTVPRKGYRIVQRG